MGSGVFVVAFVLVAAAVFSVGLSPWGGFRAALVGTGVVSPLVFLELVCGLSLTMNMRVNRSFTEAFSTGLISGVEGAVAGEMAAEAPLTRWWSGGGARVDLVDSGRDVPDLMEEAFELASDDGLEAGLKDRDSGMV